MTYNTNSAVKSTKRYTQAGEQGRSRKVRKDPSSHEDNSYKHFVLRDLKNMQDCPHRHHDNKQETRNMKAATTVDSYSELVADENEPRRHRRLQAFSKPNENILKKLGERFEANDRNRSRSRSNVRHFISSPPFDRFMENRKQASSKQLTDSLSKREQASNATNNHTRILSPTLSSGREARSSSRRKESRRSPEPASFSKGSHLLRTYKGEEKNRWELGFFPNISSNAHKTSRLHQNYSGHESEDNHEEESSTLRRGRTQNNNKCFFTESCMDQVYEENNEVEDKYFHNPGGRFNLKNKLSDTFVHGISVSQKKDSLDYVDCNAAPPRQLNHTFRQSLVRNPLLKSPYSCPKPWLCSPPPRMASPAMPVLNYEPVCCTPKCVCNNTYSSPLSALPPLAETTTECEGHACGSFLMQAQNQFTSHAHYEQPCCSQKCCNQECCNQECCNQECCNQECCKQTIICNEDINLVNQATGSRETKSMQCCKVSESKRPFERAVKNAFVPACAPLKVKSPCPMKIASSSCVPTNMTANDFAGRDKEGSNSHAFETLHEECYTTEYLPNKTLSNPSGAVACVCQRKKGSKFDMKQAIKPVCSPCLEEEEVLMHKKIAACCDPLAHEAWQESSADCRRMAYNGCSKNHKPREAEAAQRSNENIAPVFNLQEMNPYKKCFREKSAKSAEKMSCEEEEGKCYRNRCNDSVSNLGGTPSSPLPPRTTTFDPHPNVVRHKAFYKASEQQQHFTSQVANIKKQNPFERWLQVQTLTVNHNCPLAPTGYLMPCNIQRFSDHEGSDQRSNDSERAEVYNARVVYQHHNTTTTAAPLHSTYNTSGSEGKVRKDSKKGDYEVDCIRKCKATSQADNSERKTQKVQHTPKNPKVQKCVYKKNSIDKMSKCEEKKKNKMRKRMSNVEKKYISKFESDEEAENSSKCSFDYEQCKKKLKEGKHHGGVGREKNSMQVEERFYTIKSNSKEYKKRKTSLEEDFEKYNQPPRRHLPGTDSNEKQREKVKAAKHQQDSRPCSRNLGTFPGCCVENRINRAAWRSINPPCSLQTPQKVSSGATRSTGGRNFNEPLCPSPDASCKTYDACEHPHRPQHSTPFSGTEEELSCLLDQRPMLERQASHAGHKKLHVKRYLPPEFLVQTSPEPIACFRKVPGSWTEKDFINKLQKTPLERDKPSKKATRIVKKAESSYGEEEETGEKMKSSGSAISVKAKKKGKCLKKDAQKQLKRKEQTEEEEEKKEEEEEEKEEEEEEKVRVKKKVAKEESKKEVSKRRVARERGGTSHDKLPKTVTARGEEAGGDKRSPGKREQEKGGRGKKEQEKGGREKKSQERRGRKGSQEKSKKNASKRPSTENASSGKEGVLYLKKSSDKKANFSSGKSVQSILSRKTVKNAKAALNQSRSGSDGGESRRTSSGSRRKSSSGSPQMFTEAKKRSLGNSSKHHEKQQQQRRRSRQRKKQQQLQRQKKLISSDEDSECNKASLTKKKRIPDESSATASYWEAHRSAKKSSLKAQKNSKSMQSDGNIRVSDGKQSKELKRGPKSEVDVREANEGSATKKLESNTTSKRTTTAASNNSSSRSCHDTSSDDS